MLPRKSERPEYLPGLFGPTVVMAVFAAGLVVASLLTDAPRLFIVVFAVCLGGGIERACWLWSRGP